ncbi:MAG: CoA pyrophosphatase [Desulfobacteraceae bacterium]|nr:CoA pyrophosphatase [Desulfobacteraceae bacterium]
MDQKSYIEKIYSAVGMAIHPFPPDFNLFQPTGVMALFMFNDVLELLFIQKADVEGYPWRNQIAFPGGHVDEKDSSTRETALRELEEEMGISADNVQVMGSLGHFQTIRNKDIEAFTGIWNKKDKITFDPTEISRVLPIPFAHLTKVHREKGYANRQPDIMELNYPYDDVLIWGATAKILHHLIEVITHKTDVHHPKKVGANIS